MSSEAVALAGGGTRWRRFTLAFGLSFGTIAALMVLMAMGVLALPITVSGTVFEVKADSLVAHEGSSPAFIQYGSADQSSGPNFTGVAVTELPNGGVLSNMDQVVCGQTGLGGLNASWKYLIVELKADKADATGGLVVDATKLNAGSATFNNIQIGVPAPNGISHPDSVGTFAQTADGVTINSLDQQAVYTQAGTFKLSNLGLSAHLSATCPYSS
jgi:hypothetical protein